MSQHQFCDRLTVGQVIGGRVYRRTGSLDVLIDMKSLSEYLAKIAFWDPDGYASLMDAGITAKASRIVETT